MEQWEYLTVLVRADIADAGVRAYIQRQWPGLQPPQSTPVALMPRLNEWGDQGWELVHMQPVGNIRDDAAVYFDGYGYTPNNVYFCALKRRKRPPQSSV